MVVPPEVVKLKYWMSLPAAKVPLNEKLAAISADADTTDIKIVRNITLNMFPIPLVRNATAQPGRLWSAHQLEASR